MPLSGDEYQFLKGLYQRLDDEPLRPGDPLYQPIYDSPACDDPVRLLRAHIEFTDRQSIQMFSGFRGSGKTTELYRLQGELRLPYLHVVYTVPPWLQFVAPNLARTVMVPTIRQWNNDPQRSVCGAGQGAR